MNTSRQIVLITGGNTGLGFETVKLLYNSDVAYTIILSGRTLDKVHAAAEELQETCTNTRSTIDTLQLDVTNDESINAAFGYVQQKYGKVDTLINNAGASFDPLFLSGKTSIREMFNDTWDVNVTSAHVMTYNFTPLLLAASSPRLIFLTSGLSTLSGRDERIAANASPGAGWPKTAAPSIGIVAYPSAKTGLNMLMLQWKRILKNDNVKVFAVSPGLLATGLGGNKEYLKKIGAGDPATGAKVVADVVEGRRDSEEGLIVKGHGAVQPW